MAAILPEPPPALPSAFPCDRSLINNLETIQPPVSLSDMREPVAFFTLDVRRKRMEMERSTRCLIENE